MNHSIICIVTAGCYYSLFLLLIQLALSTTTTTTAFLVVGRVGVKPPSSSLAGKQQACDASQVVVARLGGVNKDSCRRSLTARTTTTTATTSTLLCLSLSDDDDNNNNKEEDQAGDEEGADLAAQFFKLAQEKGIGLEDSDLLLDDDDEEEEVGEGVGEDDDDEEEEEVNIPQGAINAFLGYDTGNVGDKLAGNVSLTDDQLYSEVKERVLDTAGGFVEYVKGARDDDDDDEDDVSEEGGMGKPKPYVPPETVPDAELTAGEVVLTVLEALRNNDNPTQNRGVEILFGYSSPGSQIMNEEGLTPAEYAGFLRETEYKVLFDNLGISIDKGDYSFDGKKAFFTARVKTGSGPLDAVAVNFILSSTGVDDDACWLVDSMLIRPQSMRRRRRR